MEDGWVLPRARGRARSGMRISRRGSRLLVLVSLAVYVDAADTRDWKMGRVLDSTAAKTYVVSSATTTDTEAGTGETQVRNMAIQTTQLVIVGNQYAYLIDDSVQKAVGLDLQGSLRRAIANRKHGCRYIVGDSIQYAQEKSSLYVRDADGKECKLDIVRQERLQTPEVQPNSSQFRSPNQAIAALRPVEKPVDVAQPDSPEEAQFKQQLIAECPEILQISYQITGGDVSAGDKSEMWQRTKKIYHGIIAQEPTLDGSQSALLRACGQAKRELEAEKNAATQVGSTAPPKLRLTSNPSGAEVSIDGEYFGSTPTLEVGQKEGTHNVRMKKQCYRPWERVIILKPGDTQAVVAELEPERVDPTKPSVAGLCDAQ